MKKKLKGWPRLPLQTASLSDYKTHNKPTRLLKSYCRIVQKDEQRRCEQLCPNFSLGYCEFTLPEIHFHIPVRVFLAED